MVDPGKNDQPVDIETAKEVVRLSELYLDGTLKLSLAADARAMQIAGLSSAAATALFIFGFNYLAHAITMDIALSWAAFAAGGAFYVALFFALWAAQPRDFNISGNLLTMWSADELRSDLVAPLMSQAEGYDIKARENIEILARNAKRIKAALRIMAAAPILAIGMGCARYFEIWTLFKFGASP